MTRYTELSLRYTSDTDAQAGLPGTITANLETGALTIWSADDPKGSVTIDDEDFEGLLDCLLEVKTKRCEGGKLAAAS